MHHVKVSPHSTHLASSRLVIILEEQPKRPDFLHLPHPQERQFSVSQVVYLSISIPNMLCATLTLRQLRSGPVSGRSRPLYARWLAGIRSAAGGSWRLCRPGSRSWRRRVCRGSGWRSTSRPRLV